MDIAKAYHIDAAPLAVWRALVDPQMIEAWGGGPVVMTYEPDSRFTLWGGDVYGTVLSVDPGVRLVEEWYAGPWPHPSTVTFSLEQGRAARCCNCSRPACLTRRSRTSTRAGTSTTSAP